MEDMRSHFEIFRSISCGIFNEYIFGIDRETEYYIDQYRHIESELFRICVLNFIKNPSLPLIDRQYGDDCPDIFCTVKQGTPISIEEMSTVERVSAGSIFNFVCFVDKAYSKREMNLAEVVIVSAPQAEWIGMSAVIPWLEVDLIESL